MDRTVVLVAEEDGPINKRVVELIEMVEIIKVAVEVEAMKDSRVATKTTLETFKAAIRDEVEVIPCLYKYCCYYYYYYNTRVLIIYCR